MAAVFNILGSEYFGEKYLKKNIILEISE